MEDQPLKLPVKFGLMLIGLFLMFLRQKRGSREALAETIIRKLGHTAAGLFLAGLFYITLNYS